MTRSSMVSQGEKSLRRCQIIHCLPVGCVTTIPHPDTGAAEFGQILGPGFVGCEGLGGNCKRRGSSIVTAGLCSDLETKLTLRCKGLNKGSAWTGRFKKLLNFVGFLSALIRCSKGFVRPLDFTTDSRLHQGTIRLGSNGIR
jgi:hypothetical protein